MIGNTTKILKAVAKKGELSLGQALKINKKFNNHVDQYPLAMLIESGYIGISMDSEKKDTGRTDEMLELKRAIFLHMFTLPKDERGDRKYMGMTQHGSIAPEEERIFLKAKGALYLDEKMEKRRERAYSFIVGVAVGVFVATFMVEWLT